MTDFYSVLQRAIASLPDGSGPQRRAVYDKARKALLKQLQSFDPPLPSSDVTAQRLALEDAIRKIENEIARQIRTRRAVQGALPASGAPRGAAGGNGETAQAPARVPRPVPTEAELRAQREQQAEALASAVSEATATDPVPVPEPAEPLAPPAADLRADPDLEAEPEPVRDTATDADDLLAAMDDVRARSAVEHVDHDTLPRDQDEWFDAPARGDRDPLDDDLSFDDDPRALDPRRDTRADRDAEPEPDHDDDDPPRDTPDTAPAVVPPPRPSRTTWRRRRKDTDRAAKQDERARKKSERKSRSATAPAPKRKEPKRKRSGGSAIGRAVLPLVVLALLVGASYAAYTQRATLLAMLDELTQPPATDTAGSRAPIRLTSDDNVDKNTDRLPSTLEGEETRAVQTTTVRSATPDGAPAAPTTPALSDTPAPTPAEEQVASTPPPAETEIETPPAAEPETEPAPVASATPAGPIGEITPNSSQQAVFYEEAAQAGEQGSATPGQVEWSMVRQSVGGGAPEPVIRANARIPERNLDATITIRENRDSALPASHLIEIEIVTPEGSEDIKVIPGVIMKETEQARGEALRGAAARVSSGLFWIALSENDVDRDMNLRLLREREWIDIPIRYESDRRAILTLHKGNDGFQSVNAAIQAWSPG